MDSIKDILTKFNPMEDKYLSREYQSFGIYLAQKLDDEHHKSLYIRFAKTIPRPILEEAYRFVSDSNAKRKAALFMWKLKELGVFKGRAKKAPVKPKKTDQ
jgi:hypothetical protein